MHVQANLPASAASARTSIPARCIPAIFRRVYDPAEGSNDVLIEVLWQLLNSGPECSENLPSNGFRATDGVGPLNEARQY
jgi:hypothetical protein